MAIALNKTGLNANDGNLKALAGTTKVQQALSLPRTRIEQTRLIEGLIQIRDCRNSQLHEKAGLRAKVAAVSEIIEHMPWYYQIEDMKNIVVFVIRNFERFFRAGTLSLS